MSRWEREGQVIEDSLDYVSELYEDDDSHKKAALAVFKL